MVKKMAVGSVGILMLISLVSGIGFAQELTPELCRQKVIEASKLIEAKGYAAFPEIKDENGPFRFAKGQGYIWIHNLEGIVLMHPIQPGRDWQNHMGERDANGRYLFVAMNRTVEKHGAGWVPYMWPKPGEEKASNNISYVKLVKFRGENYVVGSGVYDVVPEDIKSQFPDDPIYAD